MLTVRPKVAELIFRLYGRPLHPELFEVHATRKIARSNYEATIDITSAGHVITWRHANLTLAEVATTANHPLPEKRCFLSQRLKGSRHDRVECRGGIRYETHFELEPVPSEVFRIFQDQLSKEGPGQGLYCEFGSSGRLPWGAISFVYTETRSKSLLIQAFHTFPDDHAIVKSETTIRLP